MATFKVRVTRTQELEFELEAPSSEDVYDLAIEKVHEASPTWLLSHQISTDLEVDDWSEIESSAQ